jgi:four helix bundle protein
MGTKELSKKINSYRDLIVWQKAMDLVDEIYSVTKSFPKEEVYCLITQMRRSAISTPSNISEGSMRGTRKDYANFAKISLGSSAELDTQIEIAFRQKFIDKAEFKVLTDLNSEISKMLRALVNKLKLSTST